jgi:hypothetical protein
MEESEFRHTYNKIRELPCPFEKTLLSRQCDCRMARRFNLAEREGVSCTAWTAQRNCKTLLELLRQKARFTLGLTTVPGPLPHAKEVKVQTGGLTGVRRVVHPGQGPSRVEDIHALVTAARTAFGRLEELPFHEIVKAIAAHQGRRRSSRRPKD